MSNEFTQKVCAFDLIIEMKLELFGNIIIL